MEIPEIKLVAKPETEEAKNAVGDKWIDEAGPRHKLGGKPDFIQDEDWPYCRCGKKMTFYVQLDSLSGDYNLADCGIIYVFVCYDCFETKSVLQCY